ncbi:MAG: hypothetical protein H0U75_05665 [Legionella sp.]|nr:hypothetical protein [Legionella sp.]
MKYKKFAYVLLAVISVGNAGVVPCNGFKIYFKNKSPLTLIRNQAFLSGGGIYTQDPLVLEPNDEQFFTVNQSNEDRDMLANFLFLTSLKDIDGQKINFTLRNKGLYCKVSNISTSGNLKIHSHRDLGGVVFSIGSPS